MSEVFWSEEDQNFYTIPDGDIATPKQVRDYYEGEIDRLRKKIPINFTPSVLPKYPDTKKYGAYMEVRY